MPDQAKNMLIGIFVVAACAIVVFVLMFLHPSVGDEGRLLRVRFANIDKVTIGTRVTFAGKPVGEVIAITELPDADTERRSINGYVYVYELTLRVDSGVNVFNTDELSSRTSGLLGEKTVAITPGAAKPGEELRLVNTEIIYATETGTVEETLKEFKELSDKVELVLDNINDAFAKLNEGKFWENLGKSAADISDALTTLEEDKFWENLGKTAANLNEISTSLNNKEQWKNILANVDEITNKINTGKGTVGKLISDDELYLRVASFLSKGETTMNDINHYGILFHLDKGWQRLRARRMNLLQELSTPQEFRNYFNDEVDEIHTSIARVSMLLEELQSQPSCCYLDLLTNPEYKKVFAELMRRVSQLEEEVRMYNQQVVDTAVHKTELIDCCQ